MPNSVLTNLRRNLSDFWSLTFFGPNVFRQTPFRLTLVFLSVYLFVALLVFGYIWLATSTESRAWGNSSIDARVKVLKDLDDSQGHAAVVGKILSDEAVEWGFAKGVFDSSGIILAQNSRTKMEGRDLPDEIIRRGMQNLDKEATSFNLV